MAGGTPANPATPVLRPCPNLARSEFMAEDRLSNIDEFVLTLIVKVLYERPGMTSDQIAKVASNKTARRIDSLLRPSPSGGLSPRVLPRCPGQWPG